jgi:hypothetical protein
LCHYIAFLAKVKPENFKIGQNAGAGMATLYSSADRVRTMAVTNEHGVEVRGAHLSKIAKDGATGPLPVQAESKGGPGPRELWKGD